MINYNVVVKLTCIISIISKINILGYIFTLRAIKNEFLSALGTTFYNNKKLK